MPFIRHDDYLEAQTHALKRDGWTTAKLQAIGAEVRELHFVGTTGPIPPEKNRRNLKPEQLQALGALMLRLLSDLKFIEMVHGSKQRWQSEMSPCPVCRGGDASTATNETFNIAQGGGDAA
ncbi:hypothetical protein JI739_24115 [Ramlibacter sp. AW1]|uniref:Uncharacterized protein n=1 Tax=Ramlibacter aurantiacus TaxID=2801330 RepID=A0A937D673_9BURK|nr:hypothetical protein [Ramlibacter aurantiacus]MBL0423440.1 hypothetical protein [Ramlibacter aurantiacus]